MKRHKHPYFNCTSRQLRRKFYENNKKFIEDTLGYGDDPENHRVGLGCLKIIELLSELIVLNSEYAGDDINNKIVDIKNNIFNTFSVFVMEGLLKGLRNLKKEVTVFIR